MNFTLIGSIVFFLMSMLHLARLIFGIQITIDEYICPIWLSIFGFLIPLFLSIMLFRKGRLKTK